MERGLFDQEENSKAGGREPLADRMRPRRLKEFVGQEHLVGKDSLLTKAILNDALFSMIFWGPPGVGKTTLAQIIAHETKSRFVSFSAVLSGVKEIREVVKAAEEEWKYRRRRTILFVDEIHRFNKAQQDAFLPHVERGVIILIGATTENPSFEVNSALLSRCRVYVLNLLQPEEVEVILRRALEDTEQGLGVRKLKAEAEALRYLAVFSHGDARVALNALEGAAEHAAQSCGGEITAAGVREALQEKALLYDKSGEEHYNLISAVHKSLRDSDPDAALYWLGRMIAAGEDPMYIARRLVRFASEDVGNADPQALILTVSAMQAYHLLGMPEGDLALAQAAVYLAMAPKSNSVYTAYGEVRQEIKQSGALPPPLHIRNPVTTLMKDLGYGKGYQYAHNFPDHLTDQEHMPEALTGRRFFHPSDQGAERDWRKRLEEIIRRRRRTPNGESSD